MNLHRFLSETVSATVSEEALVRSLTEGFTEDGADTTPHAREALYAVARAVHRPFPGASSIDTGAAWDRAMQMVDRICENQGEDGRWTWHVPANNSHWRTGYVWSVYAWLRTVQDFGDRFQPDRLARFRKVLQRTAAARLEATEPDRALSCSADPLSLEADVPGIVTWPHHPVAIYRVPDRLPIEEAVLRVAMRIGSTPHTLTLRPA